MSDGITDGYRAQAAAETVEDELEKWLASTPEQHEEMTITITRRQAEILLDEMTPRGLYHGERIYQRMLPVDKSALSQETWDLSNMLATLTGKGAK